MNTEIIMAYCDKCENFDDEHIDGIFEVLEGAVDKYYDKLEAAKKKQPDMEW